jgi:hypothetical protein
MEPEPDRQNGKIAIPKQNRKSGSLFRRDHRFAAAHDRHELGITSSQAISASEARV